MLAFGIVTYLSVVFGELAPKAFVLARAETLATLVARPVELISVLLRPIVWVLQSSARVILRPFGIDNVVAGDAVTSADELRALVDEAEGAGVIPRAQEELLHNVFRFAAREAADVMVPAHDVDWLRADLPAKDALDDASTANHSRYPVGRQRLDDILGVVHLRDLIALMRDDSLAPVERATRPVPIVPETKDLGALLRDLRDQHQELALVVDEYGAPAGIITLEDILEEIVGEIQDEYDLPDDTLVRVDDHTVQVAGSMTVDDFNEQVGTRLPQRGPRTLAGLVFEALGRRPIEGDQTVLDGVGFTVAEVDGVRIRRLRVELARGPYSPGSS